MRTIGMALAVSLAFSSTAAQAQSQEETKALVLEEVVVIARKREENLQETPISVMAFTSDALEAQNVSDLGELNAKLPNVNIGTSGGMGNNAAFFIRGLGTARNAVNQESAVALYIDDFYYGRSDNALLSVVDVANIEVSRGPQGTLFGRNATAGAIRYITKKPEFGEFFGKLQASLGSDNRRDLKASVNMPVGETVAVSLLAATINQDGFVTNALGQDLGDKGTDLFRTYLKWDISDTVEILTQLDYSSTDIVGGVSVGLNIDDDSGEIIDTVSGDYGRSESTTLAGYDSDTFGAGFTLNWDLGNDMALKWSSTYRTLDVAGDFDFDGRAGTFFENRHIDRATDAWSSELQLSGQGENYSWLTGLFYYIEDSTDLRLSDSGRPSWRHTNFHDLESIGVFAQGSMDFTDRFSATLGLRYTSDQKEVSISEGDASDTLIVYGGETEILNDDTWSATSGRFALEYQLSSDVFLFGSYARGFRAGGINDRPRSNLPDDNFGITSFDEEILDVYEIGVRSELWDNRLRLNLTLFTQEMSDLQYNVLIPGTNRSVTKNAAEATSEGVEGELIALLTDAFSIDANIGYLKGTIDSVEAGADVAVGDRLQATPEWKYNIGANYNVNLAAGASLAFRVDYSYVDDYYTAGDSGSSNVGDYELLGFNIKYNPSGERWNASLYGKNVMDEEYYSFAVVIDSKKNGSLDNGVPQRGAEYGLKLNYNF